MSSCCLHVEIEQENLSPLTLYFFPPLPLFFSSLPAPPHPPSILCFPKPNHLSAPLPIAPLSSFSLPSASLLLTISPLPSTLTTSLVGRLSLSCCQSSRRIDDDSLEEQIRQTSEDSRALRELMEGERGKLRQSLEELQRLHSQVSTPILTPAQDVHVSPAPSGPL